MLAIVVGILIIIRKYKYQLLLLAFLYLFFRENFMLSWVKHERSFITLEPESNFFPLRVAPILEVINSFLSEPP